MMDKQRRCGSGNDMDLWRGMEELTVPATAPGQERWPAGAGGLLGEPLDRRAALKLMGASLALAGMSACGRLPQESLVPYAKRPEEVIPGRPLWFATTLDSDGYGCGVLAKSNMGRPTFLEGNPDHPASLGGMDPCLQGQVLGLYDPDRSQSILAGGEITPWQSFATMLRQIRPVWEARHGQGVALLTPSVSSPTLTAQIAELQKRYPEVRWYSYDPIDRSAAAAGAQQVFGRPLDTHYDFSSARVVLSLDANLFAEEPGHLRYARQFAQARRRTEGSAGHMMRLYVVESTATITGANADHRQAVPASRVEAAARGLALRLGLSPVPGGSSVADSWLDAVASDLRRHRGKCTVVAGYSQPPAVHALAQLINHQLGAFGTTVRHTEPIKAQGAGGLSDLVAAVEAGEVASLVMLDCNPVYDAPSDLDFDRHLDRVGLRVHLGLYADETADRSHWHLPMAHPLESWGDARAFDGTVSLVQPLIAPLYDGRTPAELVSVLAGSGQGGRARDLVRAQWQGDHKGDQTSFDAWWRESLAAGVVSGSAAQLVHPQPKASAAKDLGTPESAAGGLELQLRPDPWLLDGRYANNGWLQELPRPLTKLSWGNAALVGPATAGSLGLESGDLVALTVGDHALTAPVWVQPGQPRDTVTLSLGYGRRRAGAVGNGIGVDAYRLRTSKGRWQATGLALKREGSGPVPVSTQLHDTMEGRDFVRTATVSQLRSGAQVVPPQKRPPSIYPAQKVDGPAWGMVIDLSTCIGCMACVAACQNENNTPVVGRADVARSRAMHWIRVDRYYQGDPDSPRTLFQPVPCMQCEQAPCEYVCPVGATVHSHDGLNDMVYNRCIGTRFCSQNCPYKVRRFNWRDYRQAGFPPSPEVENPNVTVRGRGVMEKCTYCVQRIREAQIAAAREGRSLADGEVQTACQRACPTRAIQFGDLHAEDSAVAKAKQHPLNYVLLPELGTLPRTSYLARVTDPNAEVDT